MLCLLNIHEAVSWQRARPLRSSMPGFAFCCRPAVNEHPAPHPHLILLLFLGPSTCLRGSASSCSLDFSLSLAHTYTPSLFHCIHFWAFKKSSRITNQLEWQRGVKDYKRKLNEDAADHAFLILIFFLFCCCSPPIFPPSYFFLIQTCERSPSKGWQRWVRQDLTWLRNKKARVVCVSSSWFASTLAIAFGAPNTCRV